jgi:hypothetical protein
MYGTMNITFKTFTVAALPYSATNIEESDIGGTRSKHGWRGEA